MSFNVCIVSIAVYVKVFLRVKTKYRCSDRINAREVKMVLIFYEF